MNTLRQKLIQLYDKVKRIHRRDWIGNPMKLYHADDTRKEHNTGQFSGLLLMILLFAAWTGTQLFQNKEVDASQLQEGIADDIIRFHVIANSDRTEDQNLKFMVKDGLIQMLSPYLKEVTNIQEGREILLSHMNSIQSAAEAIVTNNGYHYSITVTLEPCYFPMKIYGDYTFPPGMYEALRVQIGEAKGKNWWCVMYPPLCFVDETYHIVDKDSEEQLKCLLTEEEFQVLKEKKAPVKIKSKLWKSIKKLLVKKK